MSEAAGETTGAKSRIRELARSGDHAAAFNELRRELSSRDEFLPLQQYIKTLRALDKHALKLVPLRVAVLGNSTLEHLALALEARLLLQGFAPEIHFSKFGTLAQSVLDPSSDLYAFKPDVVWVFSTYRDTLLADASPLDSPAASQERVDRAVGRTRALWAAIQQNCAAQIIQNNSDLPPHNGLGNHSATAHWGSVQLTRRYNQALALRTEPGVALFDLESASRGLGARAWFDNRLWHHSKHAITLDARAYVARKASQLVAALKGLSKKCLVLDLDNTLWGGIIGDDGVEGIQLGSTPAGEAFAEFQDYARKLKDRGVILAVCSKNEESTAKEAFVKHPDMRLRLEDISVFVANWRPKPDNIRGIAERLNIALDSLVFVDDNPVERDLVREALPMVSVPELPEDPAEYIQALESHGFFETLSVSDEDLSRVQMVSENAQRADFRESYSNLTEYLRELKMKCAVGSGGPMQLPRMAQLMQKSNQFNLTGLRYTLADFAAAERDPSLHARSFSLTDRFGDNGLISVLVLKTSGDQLEILSWVMSCRVLARGVEEFILNEVLRLAETASSARIVGKYVRTSKNKMVEGLYAKLGFACVEKSELGSTWERVLGAKTEPYPTTIQITTETPDAAH